MKIKTRNPFMSYYIDGADHCEYGKDEDKVWYLQNKLVAWQNWIMYEH